MSTAPTTVPIKDSIATKLLIAVFSFYLFVAITVTLVHMVAEYHNTKNGVIQDLAIFQKTFEQGLATEVYNLDEHAIYSILRGMVEVPIILGVYVEDPDGEKVGELGIIKGHDGQSVSVDEEGNQELIPEGQLFSELIEHRFTMYYISEDEEKLE